MNYNELIAHLENDTSIDELNKRRDEVALIIPQVRVMFDYDQNNRAHQYDLWIHSLHVAVGLPRTHDVAVSAGKTGADHMLYLAALLHDIGKPESAFTRDSDPYTHFTGHPLVSRRIVEKEVIPALKEQGVVLGCDDIRRLLYYVEYHDDHISENTEHLKRHLKMASFEEFRSLMQLQIADAKAHVMIPVIEEKLRICGMWAGEYGLEKYESLKGNKS